MADKNILANLRDIGVLSEGVQNKLAELLLRLKDLDGEEKKDFMKEVKGVFKKSISNTFRDWSTASSVPFMIHSNKLFFFAIFFIFFIMVFFVYKLFRCLKEREQKREEKKKSKQLKKKK
ncbi:hypothetical protein KPH14_006144 [Odynerus spinipes]|uniref:Uncharacterized protein n=1 Tax=Odynerus spinipes TaxID=1348599 RepID=A0AAD9RJ41_9HYME|nr:hypothetical protein KPH14_006144 [Odynerus spinipes]